MDRCDVSHCLRRKLTVDVRDSGRYEYIPRDRKFGGNTRGGITSDIEAQLLLLPRKRSVRVAYMLITPGDAELSNTMLPT